MVLFFTVTTSAFAATLQYTRMHEIVAAHKRQRMGSADPEHCMQKIQQYTQYLPPGWIGACHTRRVRSEFECVYASSYTQLAYHVVDTLVCPYVIITHAVPMADRILKFVHDNSKPVEGAGYVCAMAADQCEDAIESGVFYEALDTVGSGL